MWLWLISITKGGDKRGVAWWDKMEKKKKKKGSHRRKRQTVGRERGKRGNHPGEATDSKSEREERWRWMESDSLGGGEETWRRHGVIQRKLGCRRKPKEQWQRAAPLPSQGLWSLNIYITQCQRHKETAREGDSGLCGWLNVAGHLWSLQKCKKNKNWTWEGNVDGDWTHGILF